MNISRKTLLLWLPGCGLAVQLQLDGAAVPSTRACGFSLAQRPQLLLPDDFLLQRRPVTFPNRPAQLTQTVSLTYSRDPRSDAERAAQGSALTCPGLPGNSLPAAQVGRTGAGRPAEPGEFPAPARDPEHAAAGGRAALNPARMRPRAPR
ncbi:hypothetical protein [Deinococcus sp. Leaf326]|uniref:hypothetical protein n=1 Tax=Deinococcus sp. Leaf326 TaxID=1736338 RepID=UPI0012E276A1|nr:hypothetical protein [Deinococcus sp. Leaf326]